MAVSKIPRICHECGEAFFGFTGNKGKYCSMSCYHAGDRRRALVRFWAKVKKTETCWLWTGAVDEHGYGKSGIGPAHQIAWIETNGPVPEGLNVLHKCDNPPCCNPVDLFLGTTADNSADMVAKGRSLKGSRHPMVVVTEVIVREIRAAYIPRKNGGLTAIARRFNIAPSTVHAIISRKIWKHI